MALYSGNWVKVKSISQINPLYRDAYGVIVRWLHGDCYEVRVLGSNIVLRETEMTKA